MTTKKRLGELLLESGVIDEAMLQSALGHQRRWGGRLGQALLDLKLVPEPVIVAALARKSGIEVARLGELEPYALEQATRLVPKEFAQRNNVFPMSSDPSTITVAMSDPTNLALTDELRFRTGRRVKVCIGGDREIAEAIRAHYPQEYQAPTAIALDVAETTGDGVPLADPFEGGTTEDMRAMLEPTHHAAGRAAPPVASASPVPSRPAVRPPAPAVASVPPVVHPQRTATSAGLPVQPARAGGPAPATSPVPAARPVATPVPLPRPAATPVPLASAPVPALAVARPAPAAPPAPAHTPQAAASRAVLDRAQAARDALPGAIPRGGFAPEGPYEELTPAVVDDGEPISADLLAPEEEMVEGRVPIRELSPRDVAILDALEQVARGVEDPASPLKPARLAAALLRLLLKKKLVAEAELLDELTRR
jgi:type IV pilus assembly protein PilB